MSDSVPPYRQQPDRLLHPQDSLGKNTGVGCHFLLHFHDRGYELLGRIPCSFSISTRKYYQKPIDLKQKFIISLSYRKSAEPILETIMSRNPSWYHWFSLIQVSQIEIKVWQSCLFFFFLFLNWCFEKLLTLFSWFSEFRSHFLPDCQPELTSAWRQFIFLLMLSFLYL